MQTEADTIARLIQHERREQISVVVCLLGLLAFVTMRLIAIFRK